jgi:serine/threonine-protein kinase
MSSDASADDHGPLTDGSLLGGRYRLGELLGVGSSAAVFAATDVTDEDGPLLAVKVLHAHLCQNPDVLVAFHREGKASATVRHPRVVRVEGWGDHDAGGISVGWLALERVDGDNLLEVVNGRGRLTPDEAVEVMYGVLAGLEAIHAAGLVHRDITPRNVLISGAGEGPITRDCVHIADLGLADVTGRTARVADREVVGTPAYISPEQVTGESVDARADLYQAGALLYFLLVGHPPYPRETTALIVHAHLYAPPPVPSAHVLAAASLDRVVTRAMSKKPAARYQSAVEFREALDVAWRPTSGVATPVAAVAMTAVLPTASTPASYLPVAAVAPAPAAYRRGRSNNKAGVIAAVVIGLLVLVPVLQTIIPGSASAAGASSASPSQTVMAVVPRLAGTVDEAQAALTAQGFVVGQVSPRDSSETAGQLLEQHPEPGSMSRRGSAVDLVVASGSNVVPPVAGLSVTAAIAALKASGFVAASGGLSPSSKVGGSSPAAGQVKKLGTTITLVVVVTPSATTPTPSPVDSPTPSASPSAAASTTKPSTPTASPTATSSASGGT